MDDTKVQIEIDLNEDFDGIDLECAIAYSTDGAKEILMIIHHKWVTQIGHPEWSYLNK